MIRRVCPTGADKVDYKQFIWTEELLEEDINPTKLEVQNLVSELRMGAKKKE